MREFDLNVLLERAVRGWQTSAVMVFLFVLVALGMLASSKPVYHVEMTVVPAPSQQTGASGSTLTTLLGLSGTLQGGPNYTRYQKLLISPVVASRLEAKPGVMQEVFRNQWNPKTRQWEQPPNFRADILGWLFHLSSVPIWSPPDVTQLAKFLETKLVIVPSTTTDATPEQTRRGLSTTIS